MRYALIERALAPAWIQDTVRIGWELADGFCSVAAVNRIYCPLLDEDLSLIGVS